MQNLSASDLLLFETGFHTAQEEEFERPSINDQRQLIKSQALVDSNNGRAICEGNDDERPFAVSPAVDPQQVAVIAPSDRRQRLAAWRDQSLRDKPMWLHGDDDDEEDGDVGVCANKEQLAAAMEQEGTESSRHHAPTARSVTAAATIRIQVDTCKSIDYQGADLMQSEQKHEQQQLVAPPPSPSSSAVDLNAAVRSTAGGFLGPFDEINLQPTTSGRLYISRSSVDMTTAHHQRPQQGMRPLSAEATLLDAKLSDFQAAGSLSDSSAHKKPPPINPRDRAKFTSWKKANKYITRVHENPFNLHLDCLERLSDIKQPKENNSQSGKPKTNFANSLSHDLEAKQQEQINNTNLQPQTADLSNYANNLTHLYRKNQETMDSSNDFRTLLYNIICCLLVQDDQVLSSPSVGKMLDVIRTHLDSASRVYSHTSAQLMANLNQLNQHQQQHRQQVVQVVESLDQSCCKISSSGSLGTSSSTAGSSVCLAASNNNNNSRTENVYDFLKPDMNRTSQKPVDFRRVSSVSYNDEQLINDLCDAYEASSTGLDGAHQGQRSGSLSACANRTSFGERDYVPSPWAYRELSERRSSGPARANNSNGGGGSAGNSSQQCTSQSSLDQLTPRLAAGSVDQLQNDDSGNGTMYDFQIASDFGGYGAGHGQRRASADLLNDRAISLNSECFLAGGHGGKFRQVRRLSDFKPKQQPSYMSTDDYLSSNNNQRPNRTPSLYDEDGEYSSAVLQKCNFNGEHCGDDSDCCEPPVDVASRRAELEWTLNKLINIELKLIWLTSKDTLRRAIRKIGVPNEIRAKVWLILIEQMIETRYATASLIERARATIVDQDEFHVQLDDETQSILKQIELDVNRTMPGHRLFDDGAEGGVKLRRILVAYSIHVNRAIAYCQGFNFIVALLLSVFEGDEEKALGGFICIVDHIFPSKYYFDHYLTGARADQFLLADFICDQLIKNPTLAERKMVEGITSSITLNWFISLFHGAVPTLTRLTILDHFMLEGVKALFRFTMAILYLAFQTTPPSSCEIFTTIRNTAKDMYDIKLLLSIVNQIKLPKDSYFAIRRSFYMVQSSFNSDQFYMASLSSSGTSRNLAANKPLSVQRQPDTKPPALSMMGPQASFMGAGLPTTATGGHEAVNQQSAHQPATSAAASSFTIRNSICTDQNMQRPRTRTSADRTKICIQSIGKLGRSHLRIIDANARANERALMSPLRNCLLIGVSNCGKTLVIARQSSRRNFRSFREQDLTFHIHEICTEIFDGFYLEEAGLAIVVTQQGEMFKINCRKCLEGNTLNQPNYLDESTETLMLRDISSRMGAENHEKVKLRLATMDSLTNLLWIYVECEDMATRAARQRRGSSPIKQRRCDSPAALDGGPGQREQVLPKTATRFRNNNPFLDEIVEEVPPATGGAASQQQQQHAGPLRASQAASRTSRAGQTSPSTAGSAARPSFTRKIIIVDIITFDLFSAFAVHPNFGEITQMRASLVAFCQLSNPLSNQFSTRVVQIGPTGRYEQLLSFSDVVDYMVSVPETYRKRYHKQQQQQQAGAQTLPGKQAASGQQPQQRYSSLRRLLTHSMSFSSPDKAIQAVAACDETATSAAGNGYHNESGNNSSLTRYYRSLIKSYSMNLMDHQQGPSPDDKGDTVDSEKKEGQNCRLADASARTRPCRNQAMQPPLQDGALRSIISSSFGDFSELSETNYIPVNMAFIFRNGKIALFEFTESYAIHTRESQLDRYDYSKVIDVSKNGEDFIVTILTVFDKLIKVII